MKSTNRKLGRTGPIEYPFLEGLENPLAKKAMSVESTRAGGSVPGALAQFLKDRDRGFGLSNQSWEALTDSICCATSEFSLNSLNEAARSMVEAADRYRWVG